MMILRLELICLLFGVIILSACGGVSTPQATVRATEPPTATPTATAMTATQEPAPPVDTETPAPLPTKEAVPKVEAETPTPLPTAVPTATEVISTSGNPDLNFAQVIFVQATQGSNGLWRFDTTVRHNDEGWDHYADAWEVVDPDGNVLATRILAHPHDTEQPFTRSQSNVDIPPEIARVTVRAKCNIHGFGGQEVVVDLTTTEGENFEVIRP